MRMCHLLSDVEEKAFLFYDFLSSTVALYDQYRLPLEETLEIAKSLRIDHPRVPNGEYWDMTTDLVIHAQCGEERAILPRSCKVASDLQIWNNIEHAEIERVFWKRRGAELKFVTEEKRCLPESLVFNLDLIRPMRFYEREELPFEGYIDEMTRRLKTALQKQKDAPPLHSFSSNFDAKNGLSDGSTLRLILHLVYKKVLYIDLLCGDIRKQSVSAFRFDNMATGRRRAKVRM